jgi:hypothetical protein
MLILTEILFLGFLLPQEGIFYISIFSTIILYFYINNIIFLLPLSPVRVSDKVGFCYSSTFFLQRGHFCYNSINCCYKVSDGEVSGEVSDKSVFFLEQSTFYNSF